MNLVNMLWCYESTSLGARNIVAMGIGKAPSFGVRRDAMTFQWQLHYILVVISLIRA